ncbi:glutathione S-transferase family protein [Mesorhizobium sp. M2D.F.Ca.ET.185.01.1.1]|uniref:glutathione S-transferase family protein n=3 Tax=Mesorhizobium TaxID=68287 RepID=UPI000FCB6006|nr:MULTISPECIES: glutathione S-transferase family protein [unclassified Mesorhizobium]TGP83469.1 glutathione S-transferase family protein [bacterium M00.F.Ca.ET.227.01.1.1]TGP99424.1 glutathione S-transferase family protein [bacterium M00.F.Ca.ET.221.01.1.1]TGQ00154.1 glutathione S-transferase family protein [bacterium M00.F.Ca.ET.222.01.1.1]TGU11540.1 glutathione S-transferase family protein [bacterium M00.F.Ca.ET.163.01.1.1]TGU35139.1 glutathione S-transferase family protein [bacterium M00.F
MRSLLYTTGSPFARGIRVMLDEIGLEYERREETTTPSAASRAEWTPALQVPTLRDGDLTLWESGVIADYLLATYPQRVGRDPALASSMWRAGSEWQDRLLFASIQTLGTAATTISQMQWSGVGHHGNSHLTRCAERIAHLIGWLEERIDRDGEGFFGQVVSVQDIFLTCHLRFIANRPLDVDTRLAAHPKISALVNRMEDRASFRNNPVLWWEPGITGYEADGTPIRAI